MKNIIYFSPKLNTPIGGIKVIHRHSELINQLGGKSEVFYMYGGADKVEWFDHKAKIKTDKNFSADSDFVILPESQIFNFWKYFSENKIPYGIFVQNGYLINKNIDIHSFRQCYENAKIVITISEDCSRCICSIFPELANKIIRVFCSVDSDVFFPGLKKKLITYMPRKMRNHSELLIPLLNDSIPSEWRIEAVDGLSEKDVAKKLSESQIFLAFSDFEGLALPPIEAALSGNFVIGYTGQGGKEYWHEPIFTEIQSGDIVEFYEKINSKIKMIHDSNFSIDKKLFFGLSDYFSKEKEKKMLVRMIDEINLI